MRRGAAAAGAAIFALLTLFGAPAAAKSYRFPSVRIDATVKMDGSLLVVERRTFAFQGSFSEADYAVQWPSSKVVALTVREGDVPVDARLRGDATSTTASWSFRAQNERRTWTISYTAECAVRVYRDAAHLLWRFVGRWGVPTDRVEVTIHLPGVVEDPPLRPTTCPAPAGPIFGVATRVRPLRPGEVLAWGHGPYAGQVTITDPSTVVLTVPGLASSQYLEGSVLLPPDAVPFSAAKDRDARDQIIAVEKKLADEANAARDREQARKAAQAAAAAAREAARQRALAAEGARRAERGRWAVGIALGLALLGPILVLAARRRDRVPGVPEALQDPPDDTHPVEIAMLWSAYRGVAAPKNAYRAELLYLAARRVIELRAEGLVSEPTDLVVTLRQEPADEGPDRDFVRFLFPEEGPKEVKLSELTAQGKSGKQLTRWWRDVGSKTRASTERLRAGRSRAETALGAMAFAAGCLAGLWASTSLPQALLPPAAGLATWLLVLRVVPPRLASEDRQRFGRWLAFRKFLKDFSSLPEAPALAVVIWERYLAYAVALDVADEVERQVRALVPEQQLPSPWPNGPSGLDALRWMQVMRVSVPAFAAPVAGRMGPGTRGLGGFGSRGPGGGSAHGGWAAGGFGGMSSGAGFGGGFSGAGRGFGGGGLGGHGGGGTHGGAH